MSEVPGERGNVGVTQTLRGLGTGCDSWDSSALEGFCRVFREDRKQGNGWKESREMQIWTPYGSVQNQDGVSGLLSPQQGGAETALRENLSYFGLYRVLGDTLGSISMAHPSQPQ